MRLYWYAWLMIMKKLLLRRNTGQVICEFAQKMGVVYIKLAQILAMQNIGSLFSEKDRQFLANLCDRCNPISFQQIQKILQDEYGADYMKYFSSIDEKPLGSASISQVHRAVLSDGTVIALKIKRQDLTHKIQRDIQQIRRLINRFGRLAHFRNFIGSDKALGYYLEWIYQETNFKNEQRNILRYQEFAANVNGKIKTSAKIVVPHLFEEYCTENIIAMEFIAAPTISQLSLTPHNKVRITQAQDSYITLSFYALLHGGLMIFHGDAHGGNIYLDENDNIGFLDMGLIFELNEEEIVLARTLLLTAYAGNTEKLVDVLLKHSTFKEVDRVQLVSAMRKVNVKMREISIEQFFVEMVGIFTQYDVAPPKFLFKMVKSFMALFGLHTITDNHSSTRDLLAEQVAAFCINRGLEDARRIASMGLGLVSNSVSRSLQDGLKQGLVYQLDGLSNLCAQCQQAFEHHQELLSLISADVRG